METLPIINSVYEVYKKIIQTNNRVEKRWRYSLGQSLEMSLSALLEDLIMAKNAPKTSKAPYLIKASSNLEISMLKLRLYLELKIINETIIFQLQAQLAEIGRMLGGWLKSVNSR